MDKVDIHIMGYYSLLRKNEILTLATIPREYYVKWNKSDKEKWILYDFSYMWNLKNKTNEQA